MRSPIIPDRDRMDEQYTEADHDFRESDAYAGAKYDITFRWLGRPRDRNLLNIGCGAGLFNRQASARGFSVEGWEPDPIAFHEALADNPAGVLLQPAGLFDLEPERIPQVIVMHDVLEHISDEGLAVDRLAELLPADGLAIISVPAMPRLFGLHDELLGHYRRYTAASLRVALTRRFAVEKMRYFGASFIPITYWYSRRTRRPYPAESAASSSAVGHAFRAVCQIESRVPAPLGTALICIVRHPTATPTGPGSR